MKKKKEKKQKYIPDVVNGAPQTLKHKALFHNKRKTALNAKMDFKLRGLWW